MATTILLLADDDPDEHFLVNDALNEAGVRVDLYSVEDGQELIDYLYRKGRYAAISESPCPDLILLDLNMPRKDGYGALKEIKKNPTLRRIPVLVLTNSKAEEEIVRSYEMGVSSFITKPETFEEMVEVVETLNKYWFNTVTLIPDSMKH